MENNSHKHKLIFEALKAVINDGITVEIPVYGLSMFPTYLPGDVVTVVPVNMETLKVGDIVFFERNDRIVFHRLAKVDREQQLFLTKGDGLLAYDAPFTKKELLAVSVLHKRNNKVLKIRNSVLFKKLIVFFTPIIGLFTFIAARIWIKLKE